MRKILYFFGLLSDGDIDWLTAVGVVRALASGEVLIREATPVGALFIVLGGRFSISVAAPSARRLAQVGCGEVVGELSLLDSRPPAATVTALERSEVLAIPRDELTVKLQQDSGFAARFYHGLGVLLAHRLRNNINYVSGESLSEEAVYDDELDEGLLELVSLAGTRFDWLLRQVYGR